MNHLHIHRTKKYQIIWLSHGKTQRDFLIRYLKSYQNSKEA